MRYSQSFIPTLREDPAEARKTPSHRLLLRAGYIRQVAAGVYELLPLGLRVLRKIEGIVRDEMNRAGALEVMMPALLPAELFKESGRWELFGSTLFRLKDQKRQDFHLGPTHEEVVTDMVRGSVKSYRQLPLNLYQIQWKYRDEARPRAGLLRCREFLMKDAYSFDVDEAGALKSYQRMLNAYENIFRRVGLDYRRVAADSGAMGGSTSAEFQVLASTGEDAIVVCTSCSYAANVEAAVARRPEAPAPGEGESQRPKEVATPDKKTIEDVAEFLKVDKSATIKAGCYVYGLTSERQGAESQLALAFVRGDRRFNEIALQRELKAVWMRCAEEEELTSRGLFAGYIGLLTNGLPELGEGNILVDPELLAMTDGVAGANRGGYHTRHVHVGRVMSALGPRVRVADVRAVGKGDLCPSCGASLSEFLGIEGGHIFILGTHYSAKMGATFLDEKGTERAMVMGCYGIGVSRLIAAAVEQGHDADGISWPLAIAPYQVVLTPLAIDGAVGETAEKIYQELLALNIEVLFDDRDERPGVKFKDADLLGIPLRLTVGKKTLEQGKVELKRRSSKDVELVDVSDAGSAVASLVGSSRKGREP